MVTATPTDAGGNFTLDTHLEDLVSPVLRVSTISHDIFELGLDTVRGYYTGDATALSGGTHDGVTRLALRFQLEFPAAVRQWRPAIHQPVAVLAPSALLLSADIASVIFRQNDGLAIDKTKYVLIITA